MPRQNMNKAGYPDPTASKAEKTITEEEQKVADLVWIIKKITRWAGFDVVGRIVFQHRTSGGIYR